VRFEVRYASGAVHLVEYSGTLISVGRDPSCDLVLNDSKCSRRHAVVEAGPSGLAVRDTGSANGIFLNGKKVERGLLQEGDVVRVGEVLLKVLAEAESGTVVVAADELLPLPPASPGRAGAILTTTEVAGLPVGVIPRAGPPPKVLTPAPGPRPQARTEAPPLGRTEERPEPRREAPRLRPDAPTREEPGPLPRPLTVTVLAAIWGTAALAFAGFGVASASLLRWSGLLSLSVAVGGLALAAGAAVLAFGLWSRSPWARPLQIAVAGVGLLTCAFLPAAVTTLIYMLRAEARAVFSGRDPRDLPAAEAEALRSGSAEAGFGFSILAMVVLGLALTGVLAWLGLRDAQGLF
jgi:hypothetical protein